MKTAIFTVLALAMAPLAQASTLVCKSQPNQFGGYLSVAIDDNNQVTIMQSGGMAHYMMMLGNFPVQENLVSSEIADFTNDQNHFSLEVNDQILPDHNGPVGYLKFGQGNEALNETLNCQMQ